MHALAPNIPPLPPAAVMRPARRFVDIPNYKALFAEENLREPRAFNALLNLGVAGFEALPLSYSLSQDLEVKEIQRKLLNERGEMHFLPSKAKIAREVYNIGANDKYQVGDRLRAYELMSKIAGHVGPDVQIQNNNTVQNVMVVKDSGDDITWEQKAIKQQQSLIENAYEAPRAE